MVVFSVNPEMIRTSGLLFFFQNLVVKCRKTKAATVVVKWSALKSALPLVVVVTGQSRRAASAHDTTVV